MASIIWLALMSASPGGNWANNGNKDVAIDRCAPGVGLVGWLRRGCMDTYCPSGQRARTALAAAEQWLQIDLICSNRQNRERSGCKFPERSHCSRPATG